MALHILVGSIEPLTQALHWNPSFVGLVFVPLIGGLPEISDTISMALDKRIGMVLAASAASSIQIALLMTSILVLVSLLMPQRLSLYLALSNWSCWYWRHFFSARSPRWRACG